MQSQSSLHFRSCARVGRAHGPGLSQSELLIPPAMTQLEPMGGGEFAGMLEQTQRQVLLSAQLEPEGCEVWSCGGHHATVRGGLVCKWSQCRGN